MSELGTFLHELAGTRRNDVSGQPEVELWCDTIQRLQVTGRIAEITEQTWFYFLGVLPPQFHGGSWFMFAEGDEPLTLFWRCQGKHYGRRLTDQETTRFCALSGLPRHYGR